MKKLLLCLLILTGCSGEQPEPGGNASEPLPTSAAEPKAAKAAPGRISSLAGLYESGTNPPNQMCVVDEGGETRFGLVIWGKDLHSCSGSGTISRSGDTLRLQMAGDSACSIQAKISGKTVVFPNSVPEGCAYYCGVRARLSGATLDQKGTSRADAMRARDLVGEPLCGA